MPTIFWAGDSTVKQNTILTYPQMGIGQLFHLYLKKEVAISNHAENGRSTKSFIDESRLATIYNEIREGDFLFIQFGHNDEKIEDPARYTAPFGEYMENLGKFINVAKNKKAYPVLITPLERRDFSDSGILTEGEHGDYIAAIKEVGRQLDVSVLDLNGKSRFLLSEAGDDSSKKWFMNFESGIYPNYPEGLSDDTHLRPEGAVVFGGCIAESLKELGGIYKDLLIL